MKALVAEVMQETLERYLTEIWNLRNLATLDQVFAESVRVHSVAVQPEMGTNALGLGRIAGVRAVAATGSIRSRDELRENIARWQRAFIVLEATLDDLIVGEGRVAVRLGWRGTVLLTRGIAAVEHETAWTALEIYRFTDERIAEVWTSLDMLDRPSDGEIEGLFGSRPGG